MPLDQTIVRTWDRFGGTMLGTSRTNPFDPKNDQSKKVLDNIRRLGLEALGDLGGEDTLGAAARLARAPTHQVCIDLQSGAPRPMPEALRQAMA